MTEPNTGAEKGPDSFDRIALDLQNLRESAGHVSYAELVRRITALRIQRGIHAAAAVPARSTVYNVFMTGRARIDVALLRDVVLALGVSSEEAEAWALRCREARRAVDTAARQGAPEARLPRALPAPLARPARQLSVGAVTLFVVVCVAMNLLGLSTVHVFRLSVYLDMVGTAVASLVLGPWHGVAVAVASHSLGFLTGDLHTLEFMPVNVVGALVWGYGVRRLRLGSGLSRYISLNVGVAFACSLIAAPIVVAAFHGGQGHASELAVLHLEAMQLPFVASVFSANIVTSIVDKLLTAFLALGVFFFLHTRAGFSARHMPLVEKLGALHRSSAPVRASAMPRRA